MALIAQEDLGRGMLVLSLIRRFESSPSKICQNAFVLQRVPVKGLAGSLAEDSARLRANLFFRFFG